jgi:hypothetical protein
MSGLIILSQNSSLQISGEPSKIELSAKPGLAPTRQFGALCPVWSLLHFVEETARRATQIKHML